MAWYGWLIVVSGTVGMLGVIGKSPVGRAVRWLWRRNIAHPLSSAAAGLVHDTVRPLIDEVKANAKVQHDEQNDTLQTIKATLAEHGQRLVLIEDHITRPKGG